MPRFLLIPLLLVTWNLSLAADRPPDVRFIAVDDLNHWVGHLERNPQTITPDVPR